MSNIIPNYQRYKDDLLTFITQIIPIEEVRNYAMRFISKCLSKVKIGMKGFTFGLDKVVMVSLN